MGSFGEKLKREREMRAITLEEIAEATKIGTRSLRALEEEHFDQLPGGIFNKGFVRAYAKFLGIDEEQAVADYMTATNEVGNSTTTQLAALAEQVEQHRAAKEANEPSSGNTGAMLAAILVVVIVCGIGFGGYKMWQARKQQKEATAAATPSHAKPVAPAVIGEHPGQFGGYIDPNSVGSTAPATDSTTSSTASSSTSSPAASAPAEAMTTKNPAATGSTTPSTSNQVPLRKNIPPIAVTITAVKQAWIKVTADGTSSQELMDPASDSKKVLHFDAYEKMTIVLGNAGGVQISFNGKPLGSLGQDGQTRKLTITPQGMEQ